MVDFVAQNGLIFHKIFKIFVVINQKLCNVCGQKLVWVVSTIGTYYKHTKFRQNPRSDPKFLADLTRNDSYTYLGSGVYAEYHILENFGRRKLWQICSTKFVKVLSTNCL